MIRKLVKVCSAVSKEPMPSTIVNAAYMRVVRETFRSAMETQVHVEKVEPHNLEDKVFALIRNTTSGSAPMDIGNVAPGQPQAPGLGGSNQSTTSNSPGGSDNYPDLKITSTPRDGDRIGSGILAMSTHQEVQVVSCTVCSQGQR